MQTLKERYNIAKSKAIGEKASCPCCSKVFIKKTKQQAFCGSKQDTKCKDKYWNTVTPHKRNNTTRISPAARRWSEKQRDLSQEYDEHPFSCEGLGQWDD